MKNESGGTMRNWNYIIISLVIVVTLTMMVLYLPGLREFDIQLLKPIRKFLLQFPAYIPTFVSGFGYSNQLLWPQIAACSALLTGQKYLKAFLLVFFTHGAFLIASLMKNYICRPRPNLSTTYSFPSCHALAITCFYGILIYLVLTHVRNEFWRYFLAIVFGVFIFLTLISRLWLGVHFVTDVVAGFFIGFILVNLYIILIKAFRS